MAVKISAFKVVNTNDRLSVVDIRLFFLKNAIPETVVAGLYAQLQKTLDTHHFSIKEVILFKTGETYYIEVEFSDVDFNSHTCIGNFTRFATFKAKA